MRQLLSDIEKLGCGCHTRAPKPISVSCVCRGAEARTKFYKKMMHFCAITKSNECSLLACFESLQCPQMVLIVIKKGMFFKSFRALPLTPLGGLTAPP